MGSKKQAPRRNQTAPAHALLPQAVELHQAGQLSQAKALYERILAQLPKQFDANHLIGVIALQEGRLDDAQHLIGLALKIKPDDATAINNLGTVYLRSRRLLEAHDCFARAVQLKPNWPSALENLGTVLRQLDRPREALVPLRRALSGNPNSSVLCRQLGACLLDVDDAHAAVKMFELAIRIDPENPEVMENLAIALAGVGAYDKAQAYADKAMTLRPATSSALAAKAAVQFERGQIDAAVESYRKAATLPSATAHTHCALADALMANGLADEAIGHLRMAVDMDPNNGTARWKLAMSECQPIYRAGTDIPISRQAFSAALQELQDWFKATKPAEAYAIVGSQQPFYIAYQSFNNKDLLSEYGKLCTEWMTTMPSERAIDKPARKNTGASSANRKIRVGIVSAHIREHSVWTAITKGWIQSLDRSLIELSLFMVGKTIDAETAAAKAGVDHFEHGPRDLQSWAQTIRKGHLDVLIYPEIGMDPLTTQLAALRLVPIQAASWGHPETTGLPTIDFYLSAEAMEPAQGHSNYSERLVRLPHLGVYVEEMETRIEEVDLASLGLPTNEPLLLCPGTPYKYSPFQDTVWAHIAKGLKGKTGGRLVFFSGRNKSMDRLLEQRLRRAFKDEKADFDARVCFVPYLEKPRFFGLMRRSALLLDTIGFSGFNTALQAIECGLPVLAREGNFMRGRLASGIMRRLELPALVAVSDEKFVENAIALGSNAALLDDLRLQIANKRKLLFNDLEPIRALERFLMEVVTGAPAAA